MHKIPKKNYLILLVIAIITIGVLLYLGAWYNEANKYNTKSVIAAIVTEVSNEEFGNYVTENPNGLLYVSSPTDENIKGYEKELSKILKNNDLIKQTVYIDLDKNPNLDLSKYYIDSVKNGKKEVTNLYVVEDSKIVAYLAGNKNSYTKELTIEVLKKREYLIIMNNIVLYEPEIPGNTGNIMRTCAGTGTKLHLIEPLGFKLDEKNVRRSGVNYLENCEYYVYKNWEEFLNKNKGDFYFLTRYGRKPHTSFDYSDNKRNTYLVFGKESTGMPKDILKDHLDKCMRIPTNSNVRSLNLSNCVALMLYEVLRQQDFNDLLREEPFKGADFLEKE